jgi:hypothetical protein
VDIDDQYRLWESDAALLAEIGRTLFVQPTRVTVRLPAALAARALAAWQREGSGDQLPDESAAQRITRRRAATVSLIGLAVENQGLAGDKDVVIGFDAWHIGDAFDAADEAGLLIGLFSPE